PVRELIGVYEFVTAPFPLPDNYEPLVHPEYPWDYFEGSSSARAASRPPTARSSARAPAARVAGDRAALPIPDCCCDSSRCPPRSLKREAVMRELWCIHARA